jgi:hypothetical protein
MDSAIRVAEVFVPAVVMALLRGPLGIIYLVCAGVMKIRRRRQLRGFHRAVNRHRTTPGVLFPSGDLLRAQDHWNNESVTTR